MKRETLLKNLTRISRDLRTVLEKADADLEKEELALLEAGKELPTENTMESLLNRAEHALDTLEETLAWESQEVQG